MNWIIFFLLFSAFLESSERPDIAFLAADVKYSDAYGIKICEIQAGSFSGFSGFDTAAKETGLFAKAFCDALSAYQPMMWYINNNICDKNLKKEFKRRGFVSFDCLEDLQKDTAFQKAAKTPLRNPYDFSSYQGIVYTSKLKPEFIKKFQENYPSVLLMDAAASSFSGDKLLMSKLFNDETLKSYKPRWNHYPKRYEKGLHEKILSEIKSDIVVIKPRKASLGIGIFIVEKNDLDETLKTILLSKTNSLLGHKDPSFSWWGRDKSDSFIVEEFCESDPVIHNNKPYDGIIRISFILTRSTKGITIDFMPLVWIIPVKSLVDEGTLTEKHKSSPHKPYFVEADPVCKEKVEALLSNFLPLFYKKLLENKPL